jgi:DNA helicase-2/ATP-dependent DNA helicase PcrA
LKGKLLNKNIVKYQPNPESDIIRFEPKRVWSEYQKNIFRNIAKGTNNTLVIARAGSAKTSSLVEGAKFIPRGKKALFCAFNKSIQLTLRDKLPTYIFCATLHSLGLQAIKQRFGEVEVDDKKCFNIVQSLIGDDDKDYDLIISICKTVSFCKARLVDTPAQIDDLITEFDIDLCESNPDTFISYVSRTLKLCKEQINVVDFNDMIWFCFVYHLNPGKYDIVFIDEAQDLTRGMLELALSTMKTDGRIIAVCDDRQVLYHFAAVDLNTLEILRARLNPTELSLPICYRCPKSVVKLAQKYVPDIQPYEHAIEGIIGYIHTDDLYTKVSPGSFILSRINAPLVSICLKLISLNIRANIRGRDIGDGLQYLLKKSKKKTIPKFLEWVSKWEKREKEKLLAKDPKANTTYISDRAECLYNLCANLTTIEEVKKNIISMFKDTDEKDIVWLSSIHKMKGDQANVIFILADTLRYGSVSENNINYVSLSRAQRELYFVSKKNISENDIANNE